MKRIFGQRLLDPSHLCEVCSLERDTLIEAHALYTCWLEEYRIAKYIGVAVEGIYKHALAYGWDVERSYNTPDLYPRLLRDTIDTSIDAPKLKLNQKSITIVSRQMDLISGREQEKKRNENDFESTQRIVHEAIANLMADGEHSRAEVMERLTKYLPEFKEQLEFPSIEDVMKEDGK